LTGCLGYARCSLDLRENLLSFLQEELSRSCELQPLVATVEQRGTNFFLKVMNLPAHRRLRYPQTRCCPTYVQFLCCRNEISQMSKFHSS